MSCLAIRKARFDDGSMRKLRFGWVATALVLFTSVAEAAPGDPGTACTVGTGCTSGFCVDGVCCNTACAGQCEACNVAGAAGTCTPKTGAPAGTRAACSDGAGNVCKALTCDGIARDTCAAFANGPDKVCMAASCSGGVVTSAALCDGKGTCTASSTTTSCAPYECKGDVCGTVCTTKLDCATGFDCMAGKCSPRGGAVCSADGLSAISADGRVVSCEPYKCSGGLCRDTCSTDADCTGVTKCDAARRACLDPSASIPPAGPRGDCAFGTGAGGAGAIAALALASLARRNITQTCLTPAS